MFAKFEDVGISIMIENISFKNLKIAMNTQFVGDPLNNKTISFFHQVLCYRKHFLRKTTFL